MSECPKEIGESILPQLPSPVVGTAKQQDASGARIPSEPQQESHGTISLEPPSPTGVYFCEVKGVTHNNEDGTSRGATQLLCSIGEVVRLIPEPNNPHDRHAIRVVLQTGQQIGYISARQAARFAGTVHLLTATVYSRVKDEWGNDTLKLRVVNSAEQQAHEARSSTTKDQRPSLDSVQALQVEANETAEKEGWQSVYIYFENAERGLYQIVLAENAEHLRQILQEGRIRVGFIGMHDKPKGIRFGFALDDSVPLSSTAATRFLANAREWVVAHSKNLCAKKGVAAPIVHDFEPSKWFASARLKGSTQSVGASIVIVLFLGFILIICCVFYEVWWVAAVVAAATLAFLVWRKP